MDVELRAGVRLGIGLECLTNGTGVVISIFIIHESTVKATFNTPYELSGVIRRESRGCCTKVGGINPKAVENSRVVYSITTKISRLTL